MARLIDADTFRSNIDCCDIETYNDKLTIVEQINEAPTVDAVEVVRCKYCKHNKDGFCVGYHAHHDVMPDDFCSYGERRNDG